MATEKPANVRFVTFGCKANQYDTQILRAALLRRGLEETARGAELCVINTCTVTAEAGRKARQLIRRLGRETPSVRIAVTGCLAESEPEILRELPNVEWVLGNGEAKRPVGFLRELGFDADPEELGIPAGITEFVGHTRAFLKIQDGCDMACAFCIIPMVRGRSTSRPAPELAAEVARLVASGHREIVLCGIHIGHWGRDLGVGLEVLLRALCAVEVAGADGCPIDWRLRLSSIEATEVTDPVLEVMREHPRRIAPHLHMPMQSGDDATLEACRTAGFARIHAFPFSPRPGTAAADPATLGGAVDPGRMRERRAALSELAGELSRKFKRSLEGVRETLVLEGSVGLAGRYQRVRVAPEAFGEGLHDCRIEVREGPGGAEEIELMGFPVAENKEVAL